MLLIIRFLLLAWSIDLLLLTCVSSLANFTQIDEKRGESPMQRRLLMSDGQNETDSAANSSLKEIKSPKRPLPEAEEENVKNKKARILEDQATNTIGDPFENHDVRLSTVKSLLDATQKGRNQIDNETHQELELRSFFLPRAGFNYDLAKRIQQKISEEAKPVTEKYIGMLQDALHKLLQIDHELEHLEQQERQIMENLEEESKREKEKFDALLEDATNAESTMGLDERIANIDKTIEILKQEKKSLKGQKSMQIKRKMQRDK